MEELLWQAIEYTLAAALLSAASEKHEDGTARLLLASDVLHCVIHSMVLDIAEINLERDGGSDYPTDLAGEWARHSLRARPVNGGYASRLFDYSDFNTQHGNLNMVIRNMICLRQRRHI